MTTCTGKTFMKILQKRKCINTYFKQNDEKHSLKLVPNGFKINLILMENVLKNVKTPNETNKPITVIVSRNKTRQKI